MNIPKILKTEIMTNIFNYMKSLIRILIIGLIIMPFISCEKTEGEGGTSSIIGKVRVKNYDSSFKVLLDEYYAQEQRVYIIYGDDITHSDDVRTNYDGTYRFSFLRKGIYHIYAYSKDSTGTVASGIVPEIKTAEITKNNQHIELDDIIILD